jgi:hypothetical protein
MPTPRPTDAAGTRPNRATLPGILTATARAVAAAAGLAAALGPGAAAAQQITTAGDCSAVIQQVGGNVTVNCYLDAAARPKFRVTYYRLGGIGQSFLINGKLSPEWERYLGGQQAIVDNPVYDELRRLTERFGTEIRGGDLFGTVAFVDGGEYYESFGAYARSVDPGIATMQTDGGEMPLLDGTSGWRAFAPDELFIPDLAAADTLFNTPGWPDSYALFWGFLGTPVEWVEPGRVLTAPTLWRYLTPADLEGYETRYAQYLARAAEFAGTDQADPNAGGPSAPEFPALEAIRYLTRNGMPEKFMLVEGTPGLHYGWQFSALTRGADLLIAILENVGEQAIDVGAFRIDATDAMTIRTFEETTSLLDAADPAERRLWPPGLLRPGEKLVIPVRIELPISEEFYDWAVESYRDAQAPGEAVRREAEATASGAIDFVHPYNTGDVLFSKARDDLRAGAIPDFVQRFEYGPAWRIESVEIDGASYDFREHDPNDFILFAGGGVGSCPYVYSYQPDTGLWIEEGHFLLGAISPALKRRDELALRNFHGRLEIRETEHEIAHIDSFALKLTDAEGNVQIYPATSPTALAAEDGESLVLAHGDRAEVGFDLPDDALEGRTAAIVATGFYVPFSNPALIARSR